MAYNVEYTRRDCKGRKGIIMISITVEYSGSSYIAYLTEDRSVWESGNTVHEALGKLVMSLAALKRIEIHFL